jgi:purine nucleosidase
MRLIFFLAAAIGCAGAAQRPFPIWPPSGRVDMIIDADVANEVDDQYAISLALGFPEKIRIVGFVAAHFGDAGGETGVAKSRKELETLLDKARMAGKFPIRNGADPFQYADRIPHSDGVDFIVEQSRKATPESPLWLVLLGPATDAAAALLKAPDIASRMIVFWHGRTQWPLRAWNFNAHNDIRAARFLFELPCRFVLFDTGTYLRAPMEQTAARYAPISGLGRFLHEIRLRRPAFQAPEKGFFDLGDITAFVDPGAVRWEVVKAPRVDQGLNYDHTKTHGDIVRIYHVESKAAFDLLEQALRRIE